MSRINEGSRPSKLRIGRALAGEQPLSESEGASPEAEAWRAEIAAARPPEFDAAALRERARQLPEERRPGEVVPLFRRVAPWVGGALLLAAGLFLVVRPPPRRHDHHTKGSVDLGFFVLRDGQAFPGDEEKPVRAGDRLQFTYRSDGESELVIVGVDGSGTVQTYWPDDGDAPVSIFPGERHVLDGSILLDDAAGPEVFVGAFGDASVRDVVAEVREAFARGGVDGVEQLADTQPGVSVLVLDKE